MALGKNVHPPREKLFPESHRKKPRKAQRGRIDAPPNSSHGEERRHTLAVNEINRNIRDLRRMLEHNTVLPADVRVEKERALAGHEADLLAALQAKERHDMISKYHFVRFMERQKATRILKKAKTQLNNASPSSPEYASLKAAVHEVEVDLNYTLYAPLAEKYVSLFARREKHKQGDECQGGGAVYEPGKKPPMWYVVEGAMREGTLDALRERKSLMAIPARPKPAANSKKSHTREENGDDKMSDGGFFEE